MHRLVVACSALIAASAHAAAVPDPLEAWLDTPTPVADGFVSPRGQGRLVCAIATGDVVNVTADTVAIAHFFYDNHQPRLVTAIHHDLARIDVAPGDRVSRGQTIGALATKGAGLHLTLTPDTDPAKFIAARAHLFVPQSEGTLVLVDTTSQRMRIVTNGVRDGEDLHIGLGQVAGCKERHRDLKTPCGIYFVTGKSTGPFSGDYADYYGGHFIKLNYPNRYDAERGLSAGLVTRSQSKEISKAWSKRELPPQGTRLGGGIGIHGWAEEWDEDPHARGSWGCVFMHNRDIAAAYARIPIVAMVVLL